MKKMICEIILLGSLRPVDFWARQWCCELHHWPRASWDADVGATSLSRWRRWVHLGTGSVGGREASWWWYSPNSRQSSKCRPKVAKICLQMLVVWCCLGIFFSPGELWGIGTLHSGAAAAGTGEMPLERRSLRWPRHWNTISFLSNRKVELKMDGLKPSYMVSVSRCFKYSVRWMVEIGWNLFFLVYLDVVPFFGLCLNFTALFLCFHKHAQTFFVCMSFMFAYPSDEPQGSGLPLANRHHQANPEAFGRSKPKRWRRMPGLETADICCCDKMLIQPGALYITKW